MSETLPRVGIAAKIDRMPRWARFATASGMVAGLALSASGCGENGGSNPLLGNRPPAATAEANPLQPSSLCGQGTVFEDGKCIGIPTSESSPASGAQGGQPTEASKATFTFDSRGSNLSEGGSNVIYTYSNDQAGGEGSTDLRFMSGQSEPIECWEHGRDVSTVQSEGERAVTTDKWFKIIVGNQETYATGAYGNPSTSILNIQEC